MKHSDNGLCSFAQTLGVGPVEFVDGPLQSCRLQIVPTRRHRNDRGLVHGGFIAAVFDEVGRQFAQRLWRGGITIVGAVEFVHGARVGQPLTFVVEQRVGGFFGTATAGETCVATYTGTWKARPLRERSW